jgi:type IV secretory pathway protease TraF
MRRQCLRIVIALIGVAGFGIDVKAQVWTKSRSTYRTSL